MSKKRRRDTKESPHKTEGVNKHPKKRRLTSTCDEDVDAFFDRVEPNEAFTSETAGDDNGDVRMLRANADLVRMLAPDKKPTTETVRNVLRRILNSKHSKMWFSGLTELLRQLDNRRAEYDHAVVAQFNEFDELLDEVIEKDDLHSEESSFRRVFAYQALNQSLILGDMVNATLRTRVIDRLIHICVTAKSTELRIQAVQVLRDLIKHLKTNPREEFQSSLSCAEYVLQQLVSKHAAKSPESLCIWLAVRDRFPEAGYPKSLWHGSDPLDHQNRRLLLSIIRATVNSTSKTAPESFHPVWVAILESLLSRDSIEDTFQNEWIDIFDRILFDANAPAQCLTCGLALATIAVRTTPTGFLHVLFSPNATGTLADKFPNRAAFKQKAVHEQRTRFLSAVIARVKKDPDVAARIVAQLLKEGVLITFDKATKTSTVEELLTTASPKSMEDIVEVISGNLRDPNIAEDGRRNLTEILLNMVRNRTDLADTSKWLHELVRLFCQLAYFQPSYRQGPKSLPSTHELFLNRTYQILTHLLSKSPNGFHWLHAAALSIEEIDLGSKDLKLLAEMNQEMKKLTRKAFGDLKELIQRPDGLRASLSTALTKLFSLLLLQVFAGDSEAISALEDLGQCYHDVVNQSGVSENVIHALTDLILSLLAKPNALSRRVGEETFAGMTADLTLESLQPLYDILLKKESLKGQQELFNEEHEDEPDFGSDTDLDIEEASDVDVIEALPSESEGDADDSEGGSEDGDGDEELERFNDLLAETLRTSNPDRNAGSDEADLTDHGSDMDSDQMMEIDEQLSAAFQQRQAALKNKANKKDQKSARENVVNFKGRVLDLLAVYVKQECASVVSTSTLLPLLQLLRTTNASHLAERANKILSSQLDVCNKKKAYPAPAMEAGIDLLRKIHDEAAKDGPNVHAAACSRASLFVAKAMLMTHPSSSTAVFDAVTDEYARTMKKWFNEAAKSRTRPAFFANWIGWADEMRKARAAGKF